MRAAFAIGLSLVIALLAARAVIAETGTASGDARPFAYVTVAGAPGDGDQALAAALARQLAARGLKQADAVQANVYEVQGTVRVAPAAKGKESVTIVWVVLGPDGDQLGSHAPDQGCAQGLARQDLGQSRRCRRGSSGRGHRQAHPH